MKWCNATLMQLLSLFCQLFDGHLETLPRHTGSMEKLDCSFVNESNFHEMVGCGPSSLLALCCQFWVFELLELVCCWFAFHPRDSQLNDEELTGSCRPHRDMWSESCLCDLRWGKLMACRDVVFPAAGFCRISSGLTEEMSCHWWPEEFFLPAPCTSPTALPASSAPGCALRQHTFAPWQDVLAPKPLGLKVTLSRSCGVGQVHASTCDCLPLWPCSLLALRYCLDEVTLLLYLCDFLHNHADLSI